MHTFVDPLCRAHKLCANADRKFTRPLHAAPPAASAPACPASAAPSQAERGAAPLSLGLDRHRRLG